MKMDKMGIEMETQTFVNIRKSVFLTNLLSYGSNIRQEIWQSVPCNACLVSSNDKITIPTEFNPLPYHLHIRCL